MQPLEQSDLRLVATLSDPHPLEGRRIGGLSNAAPTVEENKSLTVLEQSMSLVVLFKCGSATGEYGYLHFVQRSVKSHFIKHRLSACESFDIIQLSGDLGGSSY